eukprot:79887-Rhodomonas_salina.3
MENTTQVSVGYAQRLEGEIRIRTWASLLCTTLPSERSDPSALTDACAWYGIPLTTAWSRVNVEVRAAEQSRTREGQWGRTWSCASMSAAAWTGKPLMSRARSSE